MASLMSLMLSLVFSGALVASTEDRECQDLLIPVESPILLSLGDTPDLSVLSLIFHGEDTGWEATFKLGENGTPPFSPRYNLLVRKSAGTKKKQFTVRLYKEGERSTPFLDERLSVAWVDGTEISLIVSQSQLSLVFKKDDRLLKVELSIQLDKIDAVEVKSTNMNVANASLCSLLPATTMIRTTDPTTTTNDPTTTTTTTDPTTTTTDPTTTSTSTTTSIPSTDLGPELLDPSTTTSPCEVVKGGVAEAAVDRKDCHDIPWWSWVCVGLMVSFVIFFFILLAYTFVLYRRNWTMAATLTRQGQYLRGRIGTTGGYGEEAQDMHYYAMNNQNLIVGNTMPRLACTPSPLPPFLAPTPSPLPPPMAPTPSPLPPVSPTPSPLPPVSPTPSPLPPMDHTPSPLTPPPPIQCTMPRSSCYRRSFSHQPEIDFPPPPGTPPPPSFLTLPSNIGQRGYLRDGLSSELCPLQEKMSLQRSEDGLADDENSDVSLSGEYGLRI